MNYQKFCWTFVLAWLFAVSATGAQTLDLRPYYANMLQDGFTAIFEGQIEDEDEEEMIEARMIFQSRLTGAGGADGETVQRVIVSFETPYGVMRIAIDGFMVISETGIIDRRTEGRTFMMGDVFTVEVENIGDPLFLPSSAEIGETLEQTFERRTRMEMPFFGTMDETFEVTQRTTFAAIEEVTVPAGTFQALRVEEEESYETEIFGITFQEVSRTTMWFAPDVGLVRLIEREQETGPAGPGPERVVSTMELTEFHEVFEQGPEDRLFFAAGSLADEDLGIELFWQPWLGFFQRVSAESGWIVHPGLGFLYPLASWGYDGLWFHAADERLGLIFIAERNVLRYEDAYNEEADRFELILSGWMYISRDGGTWAFFEVELEQGVLKFWPNGREPATVIEFGSIFPEGF